ncbi:MAG: dipeptidase PepE [Bacteroidota bacterium]|nr:dipeptidase PepE [Bacteroidota bacterium]
MRLLIVSTSKIHGSEYLEYLREEVIDFFGQNKTIVFIPYARPGGITWDEYTQLAKEKFHAFGLEMKGIHEFESPIKALEEADGVFTGGGNTFVLLQTLYHYQLVKPLRELVQGGLPYMGSSAGSNITGPSIKTTNDMPIIYPPSFNALQLVPFQINPHYLDPDPNSKHMGETRETRIKEFLVFNSTPVLGLREGSWLRIDEKKCHLKGALTARFFENGKDPREIKPGDQSWLLDV